MSTQMHKISQEEAMALLDGSAPIAQRAVELGIVGDKCEGCDKPLPDGEGKESADMYVLCDECQKA